MLFGIKLKGLAFLGLCLFFLLIVLAVCWWFTQCWAGLACFALREEEAAAASMGISPVRFKLLAFVIGTGIAGLGGALYAHYIRFVSATDFSFPVSVLLLSMVVLGGMGTLWGPVLGALILGSAAGSIPAAGELSFSVLYGAAASDNTISAGRSAGRRQSGAACVCKSLTGARLK